jgi:hypothetical protein
MALQYAFAAESLEIARLHVEPVLGGVTDEVVGGEISVSGRAHDLGYTRLTSHRPGLVSRVGLCDSDHHDFTHP